MDEEVVVVVVGMWLWVGWKAVDVDVEVQDELGDGGSIGVYEGRREEEELTV